MTRMLCFAFSLLAALAAPAALAQDEAPDALIKRISEEVVAELRKDKDIRAGDGAKIAALVDARIVPHFDFRRITQSAMGAGYRNQVIEFKPLRAAAGDTEVTVRSQVRQPGAEPIAIEYDLAKNGQEWKVFDVRIAGLSLVANYRSTFAEEVRNNGIEGLIALLARKNSTSVAHR